MSQVLWTFLRLLLLRYVGVKWLGFHVLQLLPIIQRLNLSCISKSQIETWNCMFVGILTEHIVFTIECGVVDRS
jgi:hypothetical protein